GPGARMAAAEVVALRPSGGATGISAVRSASEPYAPEQLSEIARKLASYVGPIAAILVKRASSSTQDLRVLVEQVAAEIESEDGRKKFLAAVQPQLRGRN